MYKEVNYIVNGRHVCNVCWQILFSVQEWNVGLEDKQTLEGVRKHRWTNIVFYPGTEILVLRTDEEEDEFDMYRPVH
jgi:hypothetical protein